MRYASTSAIATIVTLAAMTAHAQQVSTSLNELLPKGDTVRRELRLSLAASPMWHLEQAARVQGALGVPPLGGEIGTPQGAAVAVRMRAGEGPTLLYQGPDEEPWPFQVQDDDAQRLLEQQLSYVTLLQLVDTLDPAAGLSTEHPVGSGNGSKR